jgi:hypothetical protein
MQKFIPVAILAALLIGCKGGETTSVEGGTPSGGAATGKTYTFKLAPKQGDKFVYTMSINGGPSQQMEMGMTMNVDKVENGQSTITMSLDSMKMNGTDAPAAVLDAMKKSKTVMVIDESGKTISSKTEGAPSGSSQSISGASFPANPVKVGDSWEGTSNAGGKETKAKYTFVRVENVGGKEVAVFEVVPQGIEGLTLDGPMTVMVDVDNGMTRSMSMKGKAKGPDGKENPVSMDMKLKA